MFRKTIYLALAVSLVTAASVFADDSSGCGLGWEVTKKKSFLATTTRGTTHSIVPPTFGMTSGTSGCAAHSLAAKEIPAVQYVAVNYDMLMMDIAMGQGEYLDGFAAVLGCAGDGASQLSSAMRNDLSVSSEPASSPIQWYKNVRASASAQAVSGCSVLSG